MPAVKVSIRGSRFVTSDDLNLAIRECPEGLHVVSVVGLDHQYGKGMPREFLVLYGIYL